MTERTYTNPDFLRVMFGIDAEDKEAQAALRRLEDERQALEEELADEVEWRRSVERAERLRGLGER